MVGVVALHPRLQRDVTDCEIRMLYRGVRRRWDTINSKGEFTVAESVQYALDRQAKRGPLGKVCGLRQTARLKDIEDLAFLFPQACPPDSSLDRPVIDLGQRTPPTQLVHGSFDSPSLGVLWLCSEVRTAYGTSSFPAFPPAH